MLKRHHSLQSLNHLAAFETSARSCSFTKAAKELGVSQPATLRRQSTSDCSGETTRPLAFLNQIPAFGHRGQHSAVH
jgi:Bacterial regulatory helix-turn-helix protein, lysR family